MNIKRAKEEMKNTIEAYLRKDEYGRYEIPSIRQRPVLLIGPPGIGKTQIMEQIARECEIAFVSYTITHHTRQSAIGLPYITEKIYNGKKYSVTEYTMSEIVASIYDKIEQTGLKEGLLFIDEINCVSETLAPTMLQFLQAKTFGTHKIPEGWVIAAAGNPPEFNKSVREFDIVTLDRVKVIPVEASLSVWKEYAYQTNIHPAIISYLTIKPQYFCMIETTVDGKFFATPRGWEDLSRLIESYEKMQKRTDREVIYQYIQNQKIAKDFSNYLELYYKYQEEYQIPEILKGMRKETVFQKIKTASFDERISMVSLLLSYLGKELKQMQRKEAIVETLMKNLKGFCEESKSDAFLRMEEIIELLDQEWKQKREAELLSRIEDKNYLEVLKKIEEFYQILRKENLQEISVAWERIRELFLEENKEYEALRRKCETMLEHAFDFMEEAFGNSEEMVIFLTEMNQNYYYIRFLQEYECERYYQYNKNLLFEEQEEKIKRELEKLNLG